MSQKNKYNPFLCVVAYKLVKCGVPDSDVAKQLGVSRAVFYEWQKEKPEFKRAVELGQKEREEASTLASWVYARMSPELRKLWDKIEEWDTHKGATAYVHIEALLADKGKRVRQQLFLHALCSNGFSPSYAMSKVNITKAVLTSWMQDAEFSELIEEVQWHKKNFFEQSLCNLVAQGNPAAVIFANKSMNADRGYTPRSQVEVSGTVLHGVLDMSEFMHYLDHETRMAVLEAIRKMEKAQQEAEARRIRQLDPELVLIDAARTIPNE